MSGQFGLNSIQETFSVSLPVSGALAPYYVNFDSTKKCSHTCIN